MNKLHKAFTKTSYRSSVKHTVNPTAGSVVSEQTLSDSHEKEHLSLEENKKRIADLVDSLMKLKRKELGKPEFNNWLTD